MKNARDYEYGDGWTTPCDHVWSLRQYLIDNDLVVWSEQGLDPDGWLNVRCEKCNETFEVCLSIE